MKYLYYVTWMFIAFSFNIFSRIFTVPVNRIFILIKFWKCSEKERAREFKYWKENYNKIFFEFPDGWIVVWGFGLLYAFVSLVVMITSAYFIPVVIDSIYIFISLLLGIGTGLIYILYYRSRPWLIKKIQKHNKKFYL